uniref:YebC/PmpR family DNA-binding transcriptional regulator n=1 Tax=Escherichia coli TaxID=562 RepID=UPI0021577060
GCNPTSSKFIHTWLRFGEIMRGSLSTEFSTTELEMIAQSEVELSPEDLEIFEGLVDALEDDDDVQKVYHNVANL